MDRGTNVNRKIRLIAPCLLPLVMASSPGAQERTAAPRPARPATVARVGQLTIGQDELAQAERQAAQRYRDRNGTDVPSELADLVRRQVLENLIRQRLLSLDARRRGVTVSDAEAEAQLRLDPAFQQGGLFNEAKYLAIKASNPEAYAMALARVRDALAARKLNERMERETRPDDAAIRAELEREMAASKVQRPIQQLHWSN